ncbi:putative threonine efflux protein [marine actinobacterium PHSC20C1]|nr:putative threonine efflux protein [marine actinobacterium PHSC20C1]
MTIATFAALIAFLFPLAYSPGPGNTFFAAIGASRGPRAAIPALAGYHAATFVVTAAIGLGLGATVLMHPAFVVVLSAAGSLYVLWLAFTFIRSARSRARSASQVAAQSATTSAESAESPAPALPPAPAQKIGFWSGALVLLLNPKAYYIIVVMFAQFLRPESGSGLAAVLLITAIFTLNNLIAFLIWTAGGRMLTALFRGERAQQFIDYLFAATLIGVAIWMALPLFGLG